GLGVAKPFPMPLGPYLRSDYIVRENSLDALARRLGIDPVALIETVARFNVNARQGIDPDFKRGTNAYNLAQGDPAVKPNPSLAPIDTPPFDTVMLVPSDLGTFAGIQTDASARVLDDDGQPIPNLYAA